MSSNWTHGKGFRITGYVTRIFTPPSGKCCFLTIETPGDGKADKTEMVGFKETVSIMRNLGVGEVVQVTGTISNKLLQNKARQDVQVDGRNCWILQLVVKTVAVEGTKEKPSAGGPPPKGLSVAEQSKADKVDW